MEANRMKAIVATGYGTPDVLHLTTLPKPEPKENEVLVRVHAASATTADAMIRAGKPWYARLFLGLQKPKQPIPGTGFAGVIERVGPNATRWKAGVRVFGETTVAFSANAEYVVVPDNGVMLPMPEGMSFIEAATFCDGPLTSLNFLAEVAGLEVGQSVLIIGASGALGTAAVQLAKRMGAQVTGVCSTANVGLVRSLGADHVIDYTQDDFRRRSHTYDIVFDTIGKSSWSQCKTLLSANGQYICPVLSMRLLFAMLWTRLFGRKKAKFAATGLKPENELANMLHELREVYVDGKLEIVIDRQYPIEKVAEAHAYIDSGRKRGNVVIIMTH